MENGSRQRTAGSWAGLILPSSQFEKRTAGGVMPVVPPSARSDVPVLVTGYVVFFSFFGSKDSPFFQTAKVIAEILRASVMVANSGFIPPETRPA